MEYKVAISPRAFRDLDSIWKRISRSSTATADRVVIGLLATARSLDQFPKRGKEIEGLDGARLLVSQPYLIVYRVIDDKGKVRVLRFWHAARDIRRLRL